MRLCAPHIKTAAAVTALMISGAILTMSYPVFCEDANSVTPRIKTSVEIEAETYRANHLPWAVEVKPERVPELIKNGADVNATDEDGRTALHLAVLLNQYGTAKVLLDNGAKVNVKEHSMAPGWQGWGWYPLHLAIRNENTDMIKLLIDHGADVNAMRNDGWTPIFTAAYHGQPDVVSLLIAKGARVNPQNGEPLRVAISQNKIEAAKILLHHGATVNSSRPNGKTALHVAAGLGYTDEVKMLLANKAKVNAVDSDGETPLYEAAYGGYPDVVELLISKGANVDSRNKGNISPLKAAAVGEKDFLNSSNGQIDQKCHDWAKVRSLLSKHGAKE